MSRDMQEIVKTLNKESLDTQLALQCAPFISGLRISNLLTVKCEQYAEFVKLAKKSGWKVKILAKNSEAASDRQKTVTLIVYDEQHMKDYLSRSEVKAILTNMKYDFFDVKNADIDNLLDTFVMRYTLYKDGRSSLPDEMGVFLGYPAEDVNGYIRNSGKNSLYTSYWKVYYNLEEKHKLFNSYEKAKENIIKCLATGYHMTEVVALYA